MASVTLRGIVKRYGDNTVIKGVDLDIEDGQFVVFVGPSGCGKSTLLRMIAGLEDISEGMLELGGKVANAIEPSRRGIAMVFQSYALYPHMTVAENMGFALKLAKVPKDEIAARVRHAADILHIAHLLDRKPKALSGGQRQRVAIGRAIVRKPDVFLFDEPLSNLDAALRAQTRVELARLHRELAATMIYVTHDQVEAMTLGQKIVVFNGGRIEQAGTPLELYERPANLFVAGFLGSPRMNFLEAVVDRTGEGGVTVRLAGGAIVDVACEGCLAPGAKVTLGVRPEHVRLLPVAGAEAAGEGVPGRVTLVEYLGDVSLAYVRIGGADSGTANGAVGGAAEGADGTVAVKHAGGGALPRAGDAVRLAFAPGQAFLFDADGTALPLPHPAVNAA